MGIVNVVERYEDKARRVPQIWTQHRNGAHLELKQEEWFPLYFYVRKDASIPPAASRKIVSVSDETLRCATSTSKFIFLGNNLKILFVSLISHINKGF